METPDLKELTGLVSEGKISPQQAADQILAIAEMTSSGSVATPEGVLAGATSGEPPLRPPGRRRRRRKMKRGY